MPDPAPPAPPPAPPSDVIITLTDHAEVMGEMLLRGKVLAVPAAEAARLIAADKARESTEFDRRIAGIY